MARCYGAGARSANRDSRARPGDRTTVGILYFVFLGMRRENTISSQSLLENMVFALTL